VVAGHKVPENDDDPRITYRRPFSAPGFSRSPVLMLLAIFIARAVVRNGRLRTNAGLE
jgi:hypothetical protein